MFYRVGVIEHEVEGGLGLADEDALVDREEENWDEDEESHVQDHWTSGDVSTATSVGTHGGRRRRRRRRTTVWIFIRIRRVLTSFTL